MRKPVDTLSIADLKSFPVWRFAEDDGPTDETDVLPVSYPVATLDCIVVGTTVQLANGSLLWALIGNVDVTAPHRTEQFLTASIWSGTDWVHLARYFDFGYDKYGPAALATALGLVPDEVFPISFDLREFVTGAPTSAAGMIPQTPSKRLSRAELLALAVETPPAAN